MAPPTVKATAKLPDLRARVAELERERLNAIANWAPSLLCLVGSDGRVRPSASNARSQAAEPAVFDAPIEELGAALDELRELARGIHREVLTRRGLAAALQHAAERAPVSVELEVPAWRYDEPVEAAAYDVVSESLANVAKYARASTAAVRLRLDGGRLVVEVEDDGVGVGGADASRGTGLRGLADRVAALDGVLSVESPPGAGTRVRADIPVRDRR